MEQELGMIDSNTRDSLGRPPWARIMDGTVVINNSSIIRGLVSMTKARTVAKVPLPLLSMAVVLYSIVRHDTSQTLSDPTR